jgi:CRISPR-associated protein Cmr6
MTTPLIRNDLVGAYRDAKFAHPGLLIQRGLAVYNKDDPAEKNSHLARICNIPADPFYQNAYQRWQTLTADPQRFTALVLKIETRLYIGLTGGGMLETGCAIHHTYGVPYIPGSSLKGIVQQTIRQTPFGQKHPAACDELFGAEADPKKGYPDGLAGLITFHDGWWVPGSASKPLVQEVITGHHQDYYGHNGKTPASDFDSPVPNGQIAVQGSFLITLEGPAGWLEIARDMAEQALVHHGIGAKTRSGYGVVAVDEKAEKERKQTQEAAREKADAAQQEREKAQREAAEAARRDQLSPIDRELEDLAVQRDAYLAANPIQQKPLREKIAALVNAILKQGGELSDPDRQRAAVQLTALWDAIGWYDPGTEKKKRDKQENKRREWIDKMRNGVA